MSSTCLAEFRRRKNWVNYIQYNYSTITRFAQPELFWTIRAFFRKPFTISVVVFPKHGHIPTVWSTLTSMETGSVGRGANRPGVVARGVLRMEWWFEFGAILPSWNVPYSIWVTRTLFHWLVNAYQRRCPLRIGWYQVPKIHRFSSRSWHPRLPWQQVPGREWNMAIQK